MQNKYVGDVGDFGKYGLLRALCRADEHGTELGLGVVWYLVPDEEGGDGRHTSYLTRPDKRRHYHPCDEELYEKLLDIVVTRGERSVAAVRQRRLLPQDTRFFEEALTFSGMPAIGADARRKRLEHRLAWGQRAMDQTKECDLVFVDPDNGLQVKTERHHTRGPKYAFFDELRPYCSRGQSLVVYQHLGHEDPHRQIRRRVSQMREQLHCKDVFTLWYHRGTSRVFFLIPAAPHKDSLLERAERFVRGPWSRHGHFEPHVLLV